MTKKTKTAGGTDRDVETMLEARSLAIDWIARRLREGAEDWHEIDGLLRALDRAREISRARVELDEAEARAKRAALDAAPDGAGESVQIAFEGWTDEAAR